MATNGVVKNLVNHRRKKLELSLAREFQQKSHTHASKTYTQKHLGENYLQ